MTAEHTPGPWVVKRALNRRYYQVDDVEIKHADMGLICTLYAQNWGKSGEQDKANARLIAAAPDLLEALKALADWVHTETHGQHVDLPRANAAIAKVEGEPS